MYFTVDQIFLFQQPRTYIYVKICVYVKPTGIGFCNQGRIYTSQVCAVAGQGRIYTSKRYILLKLMVDERKMLGCCNTLAMYYLPCIIH